MWHCRNPESSPSRNMTTSRPSWTSPSLGTWGNYERISSTIVPQSLYKCECVYVLFVVGFFFHRGWGGGEVPTFADSTAPTSACATRRSTAVPEWAPATCPSTKLTSLKKRRRTMCLAAAGVSPATTGWSLHRRPRRRWNSSCGLDDTTRQKNVRLQAPPGLKTLLSMHYYTTMLRLTHGKGSFWLMRM